MKHPEIDFRMMMERRRDELAEAEHSRLVKIALEAQESSGRPVSTSWLVEFVRVIGIQLGRAMCWLGSGSKAGAASCKSVTLPEAAGANQHLVNKNMRAVLWKQSSIKPLFFLNHLAVSAVFDG